MVRGGLRDGYFSWHWTKPRGAPPNDPRGVSACLRARRGVTMRTLHAVAEEPEAGELQGRVGMIRWRVRRLLDIACVVLYLPASNTADSRRLFTALLQWVKERFRNLPVRTMEIVLTDDNTRLGENELRDQMNNVLVGRSPGQQESRMGKELRVFLLQCDLCAVNTVGSRGCGPTWSNGGRATGRIDYVLLPAGGPERCISVDINYKKAVMLQLPRCMRWMDHAPVICRFRYRCWFSVSSSNDNRAFTKKDLHVLSASPDLPQHMKNHTEQILERERIQIEMALLAHDVDAVWGILTRSANEACDLIRPQLARRRSAWDNTEVENMRMYIKSIVCMGRLCGITWKERGHAYSSRFIPSSRRVNLISHLPTMPTEYMISGKGTICIASCVHGGGERETHVYGAIWK